MCAIFRAQRQHQASGAEQQSWDQTPWLDAPGRSLIHFNVWQLGGAGAHPAPCHVVTPDIRSWSGHGGSDSIFSRSWVSGAGSLLADDISLMGHTNNNTTETIRRREISQHSLSELIELIENFHNKLKEILATFRKKIQLHALLLYDNEWIPNSRKYELYCWSQ